MRTGARAARRALSSNYPPVEPTTPPVFAVSWLLLSPPIAVASAYGALTLPPNQRWPAAIQLQAQGEALAIRAINWSIWADAGFYGDGSGGTGNVQLAPTAFDAEIVVVPDCSNLNLNPWLGMAQTPFEVANPGLAPILRHRVTERAGTIHIPAPAPGTRAGGLILEAGSSSVVLMSPVRAFANPSDPTYLNGAQLLRGGASITIAYDVIPEVHL